MSERRVWVGCLACHNAGRLVGDWLEPSEGPEWVCPNYGDAHEETWVFDSEGFGTYGESSPSDYAEKDDLIGSADDEDAFLVYAENVGWQYATLEDFEDTYRGEYDSLEDYAYEMVEHALLGEIPERIAAYIDYEKIGRDLGFDGYWAKDGYVFGP